MVPAGRHELSVRFAGSDAWRILDRASWAAFLLWLAVCLHLQAIQAGQQIQLPALIAGIAARALDVLNELRRIESSLARERPHRRMIAQPTEASRGEA